MLPQTEGYTANFTWLHMSYSSETHFSYFIPSSSCLRRLYHQPEWLHHHPRLAQRVPPQQELSVATGGPCSVPDHTGLWWLWDRRQQREFCSDFSVHWLCLSFLCKSECFCLFHNRYVSMTTLKCAVDWAPTPRSMGNSVAQRNPMLSPPFRTTWGLSSSQTTQCLRGASRPTSFLVSIK